MSWKVAPIGRGGDLLYSQAGTPSLDLRFAETKSLTDYISAQNLITFSRSSSATYVGSDGLIKTSPTNLLTYSEEFDNAAYIKDAGVSVTPNNTESPDGSSTADLINVTDNGRLYANNTSVTGVCSVYIKAGTFSHFRIHGGFVDLTVPSNSAGTVTSVGNGWYRVVSNERTTNRHFQIQAYPDNTYSVHSSSGSYYIWGAQLEQSSTVGEYVKTTGTINSAPRFDHDPVTGECLGLLVEESRTNLITYSEALDSWQIPTTESSNTTTSPGGNTAYGLDSASSQSITASNPAAITFSVFAKSGTSDFIYLRTVNWGTVCRVWFNLSTGTVGSISPASGNIKNVGISELSNGWYRVFFTLDSTGDSVGNLQITSTDADLNGNTVGYVFAWGAQVEEGAFPTSYIPTDGTLGGITRTADVVEITGTNFSSWYNQSEGTVFTQCTVANIDTPYSLQFDDTSNNNIIAFINNSNNVLVTTNSISQYSISFPVPPRGATKSIATALAGNNTSTAVDGTLYGIDTSVTLPSVTQFRKTGATVGHISRLAYWPQRLPDTTLQTITT